MKAHIPDTISISHATEIRGRRDQLSHFRVRALRVDTGQRATARFAVRQVSIPVRVVVLVHVAVRIRVVIALSAVLLRHRDAVPTTSSRINNYRTNTTHVPRPLVVTNSPKQTQSASQHTIEQSLSHGHIAPDQILVAPSLVAMQPPQEKPE